MNFAQAVFTPVIVHPLNWGADWEWGLPLIVLNVVIHVIGLGLMRRRVDRVAAGAIVKRRPISTFVLVMAATTLGATTMHAMEAGIWAVAFRILNALPDNKSAMLYSLNAITSYGHTDLSLGAHWELMGAMEALNGWLLFGLTTAFLFGILEKTRGQ